MGRELYMVGLTVKDLDKSRDFYQRIGVALPDEAVAGHHVPVKMSGGMTFFIDSRPVPREDPELGDYTTLLEFFMPTREEVDAKYNEMIEAGYKSYHVPFQTSFGMYFALVDDPDGNTILFSAE
jgi:predicted lactoylglutathione lyase